MFTTYAEKHLLRDYMHIAQNIHYSRRFPDTCPKRHKKHCGVHYKLTVRPPGQLYIIVIHRNGRSQLQRYTRMNQTGGQSL